MSEIFSVQLTAVATLALALLAFLTAVLAYLAWRKQSKEVSDQVKMLAIQTEQLAEDRKVNAEQIRVLGLQAEAINRSVRDRRRAQAAQVFIMIAGSQFGRPPIFIADARNTSSQPIYDLVVQWQTSEGEFGAPAVTPFLLPQAVETFEVVWPADEGVHGVDVSLDFRDASGVHWRTTSRGILDELCGEISPDLYRTRCTFMPQHESAHSWEPNQHLPGSQPTPG